MRTKAAIRRLALSNPLFEFVMFQLCPTMHYLNIDTLAISRTKFGVCSAYSKVANLGRTKTAACANLTVDVNTSVISPCNAWSIARTP